MEIIHCIFCGANHSPDPVVIRENGFEGHQCQACRLVYISPRPSADDIANLYAHDEAKTGAAVEQLDLLMRDLRSATVEFRQHLTALDEVGRGAEALGTASRSMETQIVGDTLPRLSGALDDFSRTSRTLDRVLQEVEQHPESLHCLGVPRLRIPGDCARLGRLRPV